MRRVMVRYTVKAGQAEHNEELVQAVYRELHERPPQGLRYATFRLDDGLSFVHVAEVEGEDNPLAQLPAFKAFTAGIGERCEQPPVSSALAEVGSFRMFASGITEES
jgi:hypothetical protein